MYRHRLRHVNLSPDVSKSLREWVYNERKDIFIQNKYDAFGPISQPGYLELPKHISVKMISHQNDI